MDINKYLNGSDEGDWYKVSGSDAEIRIKILKPKETDAMRDQCRMRVLQGRRSQETINEKKLNKLMLEKSVIDWRKLENAGEVLQCTPENKILLDENWQEFRDLWNNVVLGGDEAELLRVEEEVKN